MSAVGTSTTATSSQAAQIIVAHSLAPVIKATREMAFNATLV